MIKRVIAVVAMYLVVGCSSGNDAVEYKILGPVENHPGCIAVQEQVRDDTGTRDRGPIRIYCPPSSPTPEPK